MEFMAISLGVSIPIIESRLSKNNFFGSDETPTRYAQTQLIASHEKLSRAIYNTVVGLYNHFLELQRLHISEELRSYINDDEDGIRLSAFIQASIYVRNHPKLKDQNENARYRPLVAPKFKDPKNHTVRENRKAAVEAVDITIKEAKDFSAYRTSLYKSFDESYGKASQWFQKGVIEHVFSSFLGMKGEVPECIYTRTDSKIVPAKINKQGAELRPAFESKVEMPDWFMDKLKEQDAAFPIPRSKDKGAFQVPMQNGEDVVFYPVPWRVVVNEITNVTTAISKHIARNFDGGNPKQGAPKFRTIRDDQTFAMKTPAQIFKVEGPNVERYVQKRIEIFFNKNSKSPSKTEIKTWGREYKEKWLKAHPDRVLASHTRLSLGSLGEIPVASHGVKRLWDMTNGEEGTLAADFRVSRRGKALTVGFTVNMPDDWKRERPESYDKNTNKKVGVDFGVIDTAILSTGFEIPNIAQNIRHDGKKKVTLDDPFYSQLTKTLSYSEASKEHLRKLDISLGRHQKQMSAIEVASGITNKSSRQERKDKLPARWYREKKAIQRINKQIADIRAHHRNVVAKTLAANFDFVGIEDLNIVGMLAKNVAKVDEMGQYVKNGQSASSGMSKVLSAVGLGEIITLLEQKAYFYGTEVQKVSRWFPSSLTCSGCGVKKDKNELGLGVRKFICSHCGLEIGRDHNAAINILREAENIKDSGSKVKNEGEPEEVKDIQVLITSFGDLQKNTNDLSDEK